MNADDKDRSIYSFVRRTRDGRQHMLFVLNMTPVEYPNYKVGVPMNTKYKLLINSDEERDMEEQATEFQRKSRHARENVITGNQYVVIPLPPLTGVVYLF